MIFSSSYYAPNWTMEPRHLIWRLLAQTERWIQDTQFEGNINVLSNPDATEDVNKVSAVRARKQTEKVLAYSLDILFDRKKIL